ncbi:hypothetical protein WR25_13212 [Diploscapter pachys]|uniref:Uncharacterized protein n=1 Tax=Diploscapter pachys TaxID=2018661 RepID=A0A2A2L5S0_9BILA|nr:hypothetical protein WR25_13212 [Diploscapter pachys]
MVVAGNSMRGPALVLFVLCFTISFDSLPCLPTLLRLVHVERAALHVRWLHGRESRNTLCPGSQKLIALSLKFTSNILLDTPSNPSGMPQSLYAKDLSKSSPSTESKLCVDIFRKQTGLENFGEKSNFIQRAK